MENDGFKLGRGKIAEERQTFYLDADGSCNWTYMGVVDWEEIDSPITDYVPEGESKRLNSIVLGECDVCGHIPLRYNYILKYVGTEKIGQIANFKSATSPYAIVGSECIESLSHVDMLKIQRDMKKLEEKKNKNNALALGTYMRDVFNPAHQEIWKMQWEYFGHIKNLGGSVKYLWTKCLEGQPIQEKTFGKELKQALKKAGVELPNMREIKKILNWNPREAKETPVEEDGPTYEDFRGDDEAIGYAERAYEREADRRAGNDAGFYLGDSPEPVEEPIQMVPAGMKLEDFYGISPITGEKEVLHVRLVDEKTGKEVIPDRESYMKGWDPVIEEIEAVDWNPSTERYEPAGIRHIHLSKWIAQNRPQEAHNNTVNELNPLIKALRAIAGDDQDHAQADNGIGFSGFDTEFGHSLASKDFLTEKQIPYAKKMVWKYRKQLKEHFPEIWENVEEEVTPEGK